MYGFLTLAPLQMAPGSWRRRSSRRRTRAKPSLLREAQLQGALPDLRHCPPGYLALRQHAREGQADTVARSDFSAGAGELGAHHVPAKQLCSTIPSNGPATSRRSVSLSPIGPRAAAHVVRQPRHHALVGRHVAHEGFAALLHSTSRPSKVETEDWRMWDPVRGGQHPMVFALDRCQTANALTQSSQHSAEASASFGTVTYSKGTVTSADSQSVSSRTGASAASTKPYENKRRFLFKGTSTEQYIVPLTWAAQGDSFEFSTPTVYLEKSSPLVGINMPPEDKWVIFNVQETGYYRVNYDEKNWNLISKYLNDHANPIDDIHYLNRAQLLDDSFNLARAGYLKYKTTLGLADYLSRETDYIPWAAAYSAFSYLNRMLVNHPKYPVFQRYMSRLLDKAYGQVRSFFTRNSAPERHDEKLLMNRIVTLACVAERESCTSHSHLRLRLYLDSEFIKIKGVLYTAMELAILQIIFGVAVPDFSAGAMENWGLITYRESMLLFNDGTASARKGIATVITHELTHMWFGNLVTTHWWDATWLNEGFAQYFQFYATSLVKPAWRLMEQFVVDHHQAVMGADALPTSAALTSPAYTPAQVSARFGSITYSKGASVIRMISAIMGENKFLEALHEYLDENRYSTTIPDDLFKHLVEKFSDSNLDKIAFENLLETWTKQPGYPVLKIVRNYEDGSAAVTQARFLLKSQTTPDPTLYYVPLTWVGPGGDFSATAPKAYLAQEQTRTVTGLPGPQQWVIFNVQETGTFIRKQDAASVFSSVYGNSVGVEVALNFLDEHFDQVEEYYGSMGAINNIVVGIAGRLTTQEQRDKVCNKYHTKRKVIFYYVNHFLYL
ncbi:Decaprenyl-diphosphate synthase subunit 1 [Gryllus bimaculatus]|nr:Decaprenyl-diphosphate synthase subunit 1 [Gryllus bimaculatus]